MNEVFTVVDATALISKFNLWEERDKSIKEGYDKLNNTNISKYSTSPKMQKLEQKAQINSGMDTKNMQALTLKVE